jgi:hypothetical protein
MKCIIIAALVLVAAAVTDQEQWEMFKAKYEKSYNGMGANEAYRFSVFQNNLRRAEAYQAADSQATYGVTQFMDLTPEEFRATYAGLNLTAVRNWRANLPVFNLPAIKRQMGTDWRGSRVGPVRDQGQCGSCWAFSAAGAAEACTASSQGKLVPLSAQQIVDCCTAGGSNGCNGGFPDQCLSWAMQNNLATWDTYTYHTSKGTCKTSGFTVGLSKGNCGYHGVSGGESGTVSALSHNPVSICLDAGPLQVYNSGVISGSTCNNHQVDHAVLLVADDGASNSYVVKNSWGTGWGESGFFRLAKGVNCLAFTSENSLVY